MANYAGLLEYKPVEFTDIGKDIIGTFEKDIRDREQKKKDLEDLTRETGEKLEFDPTKIANINEVGFRIGTSGRAYIQSIHEQLIAGKIKPEDYKRALNNILTSTAQSGQRLHSLADDMAKFKERESIASTSEIETNKYILEMLSNPTLNPMYDGSGRLTLVDSSNGNVINVNALMIQRDKFDPVSALDKQMKGLGKYTTTNAQGQYVMREGGTAGVAKAKKDTVASLTGDDNNIVDILIQYPDASSTQYITSSDPKDKGKPNVIFMKWDGEKMVPEITAKQRKDASDYIGRLFDSKIDYTYKAPQKGTLTSDSDNIGYGKGVSVQDVDNRLKILNNIREKGSAHPDFALIRGKQIPRQTLLGTGGKENEAAYSGFVIQDAVPSGSPGDFKVILVNANGDTKELQMSGDELFTSANEIINVTTGEQKIASSNLIKRQTQGKGKIKLY